MPTAHVIRSHLTSSNLISAPSPTAVSPPGPFLLTHRRLLAPRRLSNCHTPLFDNNLRRALRSPKHRMVPECCPAQRSRKGASTYARVYPDGLVAAGLADSRTLFSSRQITKCCLRRCTVRTTPSYDLILLLAPPSCSRRSLHGGLRTPSAAPRSRRDRRSFPRVHSSGLVFAICPRSIASHRPDRRRSTGESSWQEEK
ncbi:hypothetical protein GY45DRAFT_923849 [Cubamyces sp. BRFM 1775]|nr:hypothetical protein GY45DRAFT_923849 [Cubamyces sp. BRFM 1775]